MIVRMASMTVVTVVVVVVVVVAMQDRLVRIVISRCCCRSGDFILINLQFVLVLSSWCW